MRAILTRKLTRNAVAVAVGLALAGVSHAQTAEDGLEEVVVTGTRATLANALAKQRASDKVASVVDSDAAGNFADINVSESLRRLPGIMVENDQGEGRYVSVRGMNADLNAMTINGVSTASPENRRGIMLDGVPTDMLESMTVYKTLTPNLDADTIGGAIDLETVTAFKYDGMNVRVKAETSYNDLSEDAGNPKFALMASNRWEMGEGEFGAALTVTRQQRRILSLNNETGGWGPGVALDTDYEMRFYDIEREREGVVLNLDYRGDSGRNYYGRFLWNEYTDTEDRAKWETRRSLQAPSTVAGNVFTYPFQRIDSESRPRVEVRSIASAQIGGEFQLGERSTLRAEVFGSQAEQDDTDKWNVIFRSRQLAVPQTYDNTNPRQPVLPFAAALYDPANYSLSAFEAEFAVADDQDAGFRLDLTYALNDATELQYGVKLRLREKNNDFNFCGYDPVSGSTLAAYENRTLAPWFGNVPGPLPTYGAGRSLIPTLGAGVVALSDGTTCPSPGSRWDLSGDEDAESIAADWYTEEDVASGYVMATTRTDRTTWVYGLRYEDTRARYSGKQFDGDAFAGLVSFDNDYGFLAPSLNVKFDLADDKIVRFGLFRSLVRPGFAEAAAGAEIDLEDNEISGGNPGLAPTKAWNADLGFEWYVSPETFLGAGVFYKDLRDPIVAVEANDAVLRGRTWDLAETFINTEDTTIWGAELAFQTVFRNGFLVTFNYTYADGETDLPADSAFGVRTVPFFKQAENTINASIGYDKGPWDLRVSANYRDDYLDSIGGGPLSDRYTSEFLQVDFKGRYEVNDRLTLSGSVINLNDRPEYYYFGNRSRLSQYDEFGTTYEVGFTYNF